AGARRRHRRAGARRRRPGAAVPRHGAGMAGPAAFALRMTQTGLAMTDPYTDRHAEALDDADPLRALRAEFHLPRHGDGEQAYFVGNSLGLQPKSARAHVEDVLDKWAAEAVEAHFTGT